MVTTLFSKLILQHDRLPHADLSVKSPASGTLQLDYVAEDFLRLGILGELQQIHLAGNQLVAPFQGRCVRRDDLGSLISFVNPQGLRLDVQFPDAYQHFGQGFQWHVPADCQVQTGQSILTFDGSRLQQWLSPAQCFIQLHDHPKFLKVYGRSGFVAAGDDLLYSIELKKAV